MNRVPRALAPLVAVAVGILLMLTDPGRAERVRTLGPSAEITTDGGDTRWVNVAGDTMTGALQCNAGAYVVGQLDVDGGVVVRGTLTAVGATTITGVTNANGGIVAQAGNLSVASPDGGILLGPNRVAVTGALTVTGAATVTGATNANGGIVAQAGNLTVASPDGGVLVTGRLAVTGNLSATGTALVGGATTLQGALTQSGGQIDLYNGGPAGPMMVMGSDNTASTTRTNNTTKSSRMGIAHYANAEEPMGVFVGAVLTADSYILIGGGSSIMNAPMEIAFFTAANTTTLTGTKRLEILSTGFIDVVATQSSGTCTLNGASPSVCTATTTAGAHCVCSSVGATAVIAAQGCAVNLVTTTLTITSANGASNDVNYHCF